MLSITSLSADVARLTAVLRILRPVADEIVVGIDGRIDAGLEPLLVRPKPAWLHGRFRLPAQATAPRWRPDKVVVMPAGSRRNRLRLEVTALRLRQRSNGGGQETFGR